MATDTTTIVCKKTTMEKLKAAKEHPRMTMDELLEQLVESYVNQRE
jgi:hypothetical protein